MARPGAVRSFRQLRRFQHVINSDKVFGTDRRRRAARTASPVFHLSQRAMRGRKSPSAFRQTGSPKEFRMSREAAIANAEAYFDCGAFKTDLARRVAIPTESQNPERAAELRRYIETEMRPALEAMGFVCRTLTQGNARGPFLYAERKEDKALPTVLGYGHGDVIRGLESGWQDGLSPWQLTEVDGRYYGRGVVDNKGQHTIDIAAQAAVLKTRGKLGFNAKWLIEMGEETGSPGLRELCAEHRDLPRRP